MSARSRTVLALAPLLLSGCVRVLDAATGAERLEPAALLERLPGPLVVDLRPEAAYARGHVAGAVNLAFADVNGYLARVGARGDREVVFACEDGIDASLAVPTARLHGLRAWALAGGMARWRQLGLPLGTAPRPLDVDSTAAPAVVLTRLQQAIDVTSGLVIKPTYMLLALVLLLWIRRARERPLRLLWHATLWFLVGESFCAVNLAYHLPGRVYLSDLLHGVGMVGMSALLPWGLYALADERVLRLTDASAACRVQALCGRCWKRDPVRCPLHDLMFLAAAAGAALALIPLGLELRPAQTATVIFGTPTDLGVPILNHLVELRLYPVLGSLAFLAALWLLRGGPAAARRAEPVFFLAVGFAGYALFRFFLSSAFRDAPYWSDFWEELTELLAFGGVGLLLLLFRRPLGLGGRQDALAPAQGR